ncbi:MAG: tetratricopeptide (TPR) repeat protein [Glaciecola sp.]|jgi:tetratricopeptide (TPR) repeat protein
MQNTPTSELIAEAKKLLSIGDLAAAIAFLKDSLTKQPYFYEGWLLLSKYLFDAGYIKESIQVGKSAEQFDPLQDDFRVIQLKMQKNVFSEAEQIAIQMLKKQPGHPRAIFTLAHIASSRNHADSSVKILQEGLNYSPTNLILRQMLIASQESAGNYEAAIDSTRTLTIIDNSFEALWSFIGLLLKLGQHTEILSICERAKAKSNNDNLKMSQIDLVRGQTLRIMGKRDGSISAFRASLASNPKNASVWWALADMKNFEFSDDDINAIKALLETPRISQTTKCITMFALAKASESYNSWESTMHLYHEANRLHDIKRFDPVHVGKEFQARMQAFSKKVLAIQSDQFNDAVTPIFIVGLPRSGSTLLEQILASHSQIEGTIEQPTMPCTERKAEAMCSSKFNTDLFSSLGSLSPVDLNELGQSYLVDGQLFRKQKTAFFTDKLPFNFRHIGLIHKILPNAIIIDVRRNPLDCGFSLYKQYFPSGVDFSYNLSHIGAFYNDYVQLMDYWEQALPGKILRVQYEELIHSPVQQIGKLLEHVGVQFESDCLNFHSTSRIVHTASSEQVRQPINIKGIGSWRKFEHSLGLLKESLGKNTLEKNSKYIDM